MSLGDYFHVVSKNKIGKFIYTLFGILDSHTHIRLKPVVKFFKEYFCNFNFTTPIKILELGCGSGVNAFEIYKLSNKKENEFKYIGIDLSSEAIKIVNLVLEYFQINKDKISFINTNPIST